MADGEMRDPSSGLSVQEAHVLCPLDEEKLVGFTSTAIPSVETKTLDRRPPREEQEPDSNSDTPFDAHVAGWEVVDGGTQAGYELSHSASDHSDLIEDKSTTYQRSDGRKQRELHEAKGKQPVPTLAPHIHPDDFEDPISDEFWNGVWVACAEHNVSTCWSHNVS